MLKMRCRACSQPMGIDRSLCGKQVKCPHCGEVNKVPHPKPAHDAADAPSAPQQPAAGKSSGEQLAGAAVEPSEGGTANRAIEMAAQQPFAAAPAVQIAVQAPARPRHGRRTIPSSRRKRSAGLAMLIGGGSAAVLVTVAIAVFLLRSDSLSQPAAKPDRQTAAVDPPHAPRVVPPTDAVETPASQTEVDSRVAETEADGPPARPEQEPSDPGLSSENDTDRPWDEHPPETPEPLPEDIEPTGLASVGSDLPRVEFDGSPPPSFENNALPQFSTVGLTDDDVNQLLKLYDSRALFAVREYPTLRRVFADRFERSHREEIKAAWGEDAEALEEWLAENRILKEELFLAIDPQTDDVMAALRVFKELKDQFPDQILPYANLAIAVAVTWDQPRAIYDYGGHQRRAKATLPDGMLGAGDNFAYFLKTEQVMQGRGQWLPWEFLVHTVNHKTPLSERQWALNNYLAARAMIGRCYGDVPYDQLMLESGSAQARLNDRAYTLENLRSYGGVCALQADFASRVGKSLAVPAAYVGGESAYGGLHAWVMWVELKTVTPKSILFSLESFGRYRGDKYYVGTLKDPKSGQNITDRQLELRLHTVGMDPIAKRHAELVMAAYPTVKDKRSFAVNDQFSYMSRTVELCPGNEQAWIQVAGMASDEVVKQKHRKQMTGILNQLFSTFANFPDFTWTIFDDLISFEDRLKERIKLYERLVLLYQAAQRPDLASEARLRLTDLLVEDGRQLEAIDGLAVTVQAFVDEGRYVPRMLDRIELICQDYEGSAPHLLQFYHSFLPKIPQMRGNSPSKYCMQMFERGIQRFQQHGDPAAARLYQAQLAEIQAGRGRRS